MDKGKAKGFFRFRLSDNLFYCPDRASRESYGTVDHYTRRDDREGLVSQQHPRNCKGCPGRAASQTLEPQHALPQWFSGGTDTQTLYTLFQAPRVSTFGFPKMLKKVTQQSKAAPNITAAPPSPLYQSLKASGHRHRRLSPKN